MTIPLKDIKILWAKAAGRCSMPECRLQVVQRASNDVPSSNVLIGEACHIVAEQNGGPRGTSLLSPADRNRYPNLVLLCRIHHTIIDGDPAVWPIERLHQLKSDHELWVETQLVDKAENAADTVYIDLVNSAVEDLLLNRWDSVTDHAVRTLLFEEFVEGASRFDAKVFKAIWPRTRKELEAEIKNLATRLEAYLKEFMSRARQREDGVWAEDNAWKAIWVKDHEHYDRRAKESSDWYANCFKLLCDLVVALNAFAAAVRSSLNPNFFISSGHFTISDSMGTTNGLTPTHYLPKEYSRTY
jgi:hypothetical protein